MNDRLTILLLTKNEAGNVGPLIAGLKRELQSAQPVFVVMDASSDSTAREAEQAGATVVVDPSPYGVALTRGLREADSEWVMVLDADGSHRPQDALRLWQAREEADLVVGSRFVAGCGSHEGSPGCFRLWPRCPRATLARGSGSTGAAFSQTQIPKPDSSTCSPSCWPMPR